MPNKIERLSSTSTGLSLSSAAETTACVPYGAVAGGMVHVLAANGATKIVWHVAYDPHGPRFAVSDGYVAQETSIAALTSYPVPDACYAAPYICPAVDSGDATVAISVKG